MLGCKKFMSSRTETITVTLIRKSTVSLMKDSIETEEKIRQMLADCAQHSTGTASKYYDLLDNKGVGIYSSFNL